MVVRQKRNWITILAVVVSVLFSSLIFTSPAAAAEGETWDTRTFSESLVSPRVYFGGGLFILNDDFSNYFYTSVDGVNWTNRSVSSSFRYMYDFAYGNGIYVATGQNESVQGAGQPIKMFYSTDGINWSLTNTIPGWANQWVVTFGNNKFVAAKGGSCGTNCISYSSDGINWTLATTPSLGSGPIINFTDIIYTGSTFYAVSGGGAVITSTDGISWTYQTTISGISTWTDYVNELAFGNSTVVGVGPNGRINTSTSPATWTKRTGNPSGNITLNDISFGQSNFVAVSGQGNIMRSSDGITWSNSGSFNVANSTNALLTIAYGNGIFVTFGQGNSYFTSGNTSPSAPTSLTATAGDGQASISFTAGSDGGSAITNYKYSLDGTTYTTLSPAVSTSPVTISGLTNATAYSIYLKAINAIGESSASASVSVTPTAAPVVSSSGTRPADYFEPIKEVVMNKKKVSWEPNSKIVISKYDSRTKRTTIIENTSGQFVFPKASPGYSISYSIMATDGTVLKTLTLKSKPTVPKIAKAFAQKSVTSTTNKKITINAQWKKDSSHKKYLVKITLDNGKTITAITTDPNFSIITDETKGATLTITAVGKNKLTSTVTRKI